jgi:hypothetical protein
MQKVNHNDCWGKIPPEEKILLLRTTNSTATLSAAVLVAAASGLAIGFHFPWLFWGALLIVPVLFKIVANSRFKQEKSKLMLLYLAARSAARRFAFKYKSKDLTVLLLFRANLASHTDSSVQEEGEKRFNVIQEKPDASIAVWIALFSDVVIIFREEAGGARIQFAHTVDMRLRVSGFSLDGSGEYSSSRVVILESEDKTRKLRAVRLTSRTPGALVVFEKKLQASLLTVREAPPKRVAEKRS